MSDDLPIAIVRITDERGKLLARFMVSHGGMSAEQIAAYFQNEAIERFNAFALVKPQGRDNPLRWNWFWYCVPAALAVLYFATYLWW